MKPESATTLAWAAVAALFLGLTISSPSGQFLTLLVAGLLATAPVLSASRRPRVAGGAMLALSIALAFQGYPAFEKEMKDYRKRAAGRSAAVPATSPLQLQKNK